MAARSKSNRTARSNAKSKTPGKSKSVPAGAPPAHTLARAPARLARVAKGRKPQYFSDPAVDKLLWMTVTLMEELAVTRDRLDTVERLLARKRVVKRNEIEGYEPAPAEASERDAQRAAYIERVMRTVQAELEEVRGREPPPSDAEILAAVDS